jgi:hypothetical protein
MKALRLCIALLAFTSCREASSPSQPAGTGINLSVSVSPKVADAQNPATISFRVANDGHNIVERMAGCSESAGGMALTLFDSSGTKVYLSPQFLRPLCLDHMTQFYPGEVFTSTAQFNGSLYTSSGPMYAAGPGSYAAVVTFRVASEGGAWSTIEQRTVFQWKTE